MFGRRNSFDDGFSLADWLQAPVRWVRRQLRRFSRPDTFAERRRNWILDALAFPFRLLAGIGVFLVSGWAGTRSQWAFFLGIPALGGFLSVLMGTLAFSYLSPRNYTRYHANGLMLLQDKDFENAEGFLRKACVLRFPKGLDGIPAAEKDWMVDVGDAVYRREENLDRGIEWIELISPPDSVGNFKGHMWIAVHLLSLPDGPSPEQLVTIKRHLDYAELLKDSYRDDKELEFRLNVAFVEYFRRTSRMAEAVDQNNDRFGRIVELAPGGLPEYLAALKELDQMERFRVAYRDGMTRLTELAGENPNDLTLWIAIGKSELLNGSYAEGLTKLDRGRRQMTDVRARGGLTRFISFYLMEWHRTEFAWDDEVKFKRGVVLLCQSLRYLPENPDAVNGAIVMLRDPRLNDQPEAWLIDVLGDRDVGAFVQALLGAHALWNDPERGVEKARSYWSIAETLNSPGDTGVSSVSIVLSSMALLMDHTDPAQLQQATELLDVAMNNSPQIDIYRLSKAQLLMRTEHWGGAQQILDEMIRAGSKLQRPALSLAIECAKRLNNSEAMARYQSLLGEF